MYLYTTSATPTTENLPRHNKQQLTQLAAADIGTEVAIDVATTSPFRCYRNIF